MGLIFGLLLKTLGLWVRSVILPFGAHRRAWRDAAFA